MLDLPKLDIPVEARVVSIRARTAQVHFGDKYQYMKTVPRASILKLSDASRSSESHTASQGAAASSTSIPPPRTSFSSEALSSSQHEHWSYNDSSLNYCLHHFQTGTQNHYAGTLIRLAETKLTRINRKNGLIGENVNSVDLETITRSRATLMDGPRLGAL